MSATRIERDSMGEMPVPADALYGAQTARAAANFPISGWRMPRRFIAALALVKQAAAAAHRKAGRLGKREADAIGQAAQEIIDGLHDDQFIVDVFQTGSGTSSNMNANEVIARRAMQLAGEGTGPLLAAQEGDAGPAALHPNDHVNMGQSSNDVVPTAVHVAAALAIQGELVPALKALRAMLARKAKQFDGVVKVGRTHLQDAVPMRLGQEFAGYAAAVDDCLAALKDATAMLCELAIGGTAVGTGLNAPPGFAAEVCRILAGKTRLPFRETDNHFSAQSLPIPSLRASSALKLTAIALSKIANDIRWLASGPHCGLGELTLPATQPGSSIMPGKENPVICEAVIQVACQVIGNDAAITTAAAGGVGSILEIHLAWPLVANNLLCSVTLLTNAAKVFAERCLKDLSANAARCAELVERSLMQVTALAPRIGYDAAAALAKEAKAAGKTIRQLALERKLMSAEELDQTLDLRAMT